MWKEYVFRSIRQLKRSLIRNSVIFLIIYVMVVVLTGVTNVALQIDSIYQQSNLDYTQKLKIISVRNDLLSEQHINQIREIEGVKAVIPLTSQIGLPWLNVTIEKYQVLPSRLVYYDPQYTLFFSDKGIMEQPVKEPGIIVSADMVNNIMEIEDYKSLFNLEESVSQEFMDIGTIRLIKQYQEMNLSGPSGITSSNLKGRIMTFSFEQKYLRELSEGNSKYEEPITGVLKPDFLSVSKSVIFVPEGMLGKTNVNYEQLYILTKKVEDVERVTKDITKMGLKTFSELEAIKGMMKKRVESLNQLLVILGFIVIVAIAGFVNCWQSILRERSGEIAIMKSLGASSVQIVGGILLESVLLFGSATVAALITIYIIFRFISNNLVVESPFNAVKVIDIEADAVQFLFEIPYFLYPAVLIIVLGVGLFLTYFSSRKMFRMNYLALLKKG